MGNQQQPHPYISNDNSTCTPTLKKDQQLKIHSQNNFEQTTRPSITLRTKRSRRMVVDKKTPVLDSPLDTSITTNNSTGIKHGLLPSSTCEKCLKFEDRLNLKSNVRSTSFETKNDLKQLKLDLTSRRGTKDHSYKPVQTLNSSDQKPSKSTSTVKLILKGKGKREGIDPLNSGHSTETVTGSTPTHHSHQPLKFGRYIFSTKDISKLPLLFQATWLTTHKLSGEIILKFLSPPVKVEGVEISTKIQTSTLNQTDASSAPVMLENADVQTEIITTPREHHVKEKPTTNYPSSSSDSGGSNSNSSGDDSDSLKSSSENEESDETLSNVITSDEESFDETNAVSHEATQSGPKKNKEVDYYHRMVIPSPLGVVNKVIGLLASQAAQPRTVNGESTENGGKQNGTSQDESSTDGRDSSSSNNSAGSSPSHNNNASNDSGSESDDEIIPEELNNSVNNKYAKVEIIDGTKNVKYGTAYWVQRNVITVQVLASFVFDECKVICFKDHTTDVKLMETLSFVDHFSKQNSTTRENVNANAMFEASFKKKLPFTSGRPETQKFIWLTAEFYLKGKLIHKSSTEKFFVCSRPNVETNGKSQSARTKVQSTQYTFHNTVIPNSPSQNGTGNHDQHQSQNQSNDQRASPNNNHHISQQRNSPQETTNHSPNHSINQHTHQHVHHHAQQHNQQQRLAYIQQQQQPQQQREQQFYIQQQDQHVKMQQEQQRMQKEEAFFRSIANEPNTAVNSPRMNLSHNSQLYHEMVHDSKQTQDQTTIVVNKTPQIEIQISELHPANGPLDGGQVVTLMGNFQSLIALSPVDLQIYFGLIPATKIDIIDSTRIVCITPPRFIPGTVKVVCVLNGRELTSSLSYVYTQGETKSQPQDHHRHRHYHLHHHHHPYKSNPNHLESSNSTRNSPVHFGYNSSNQKSGSFISTFPLPSSTQRKFSSSGQNNSYPNGKS